MKIINTIHLRSFIIITFKVYFFFLRVTIPENKIDFSELGIQSFQPDFMRPIPTSLPLDDEEVLKIINL